MFRSYLYSRKLDACHIISHTRIKTFRSPDVMFRNTIKIPKAYAMKYYYAHTYHTYNLKEMRTTRARLEFPGRIELKGRRNVIKRVVLRT
jgi:hypothetical protein